CAPAACPRPCGKSRRRRRPRPSSRPPPRPATAGPRPPTAAPRRRRAPPARSRPAPPSSRSPRAAPTRLRRRKAGSRNDSKPAAALRERRCGAGGVACRPRANEKPPLVAMNTTAGASVRFGYSDGPYAGGLRTLRTLPYLELDPLVFLERAKSAALNLRVVDKDISGAVLRRNKAEALFRVEPLHSSLWHSCSFSVTGCGTPSFGTPGLFRPQILRGTAGCHSGFPSSQEPRPQRR